MTRSSRSKTSKERSSPTISSATSAPTSYPAAGGDDRIEGDAGGTPQGSFDYMSGDSRQRSHRRSGLNDTANGGADNDTATFVGDAINLNFNTNTFSIDGQGIWLAEFETYVGLEGSDTVVGAAHGEHDQSRRRQQDFAYGMGGNDFIFASAGADTMDGGAGFDTIVFHKAMVADWQAGVLDADIASDPWVSWEAIQGSAGADRIRTNSWGFAVELRGGAGNDVLATGVSGIVSDTLRGEAGDDQLNGGAGADLMEGGADNDTYFVDSVFDKVVEAANQGNDTVVTSTSFVLSGASSVETVQTVSSAAATAINLVGNAYSNKLFGNAASNSLNGAGGADAMRGFAGNDFYIVDHAGDAIVEIAGQGIDTVMSSTSYSLAAGVSVEILKTTSAVATTVLSLSGNELVNTLEGNAGANALNGRGGADTMRGFAGNDIYYVDNALDNVIEGGGQGSDTILTTVSYVMGSGAVVEALRAASPAATTAINLVGNAIANTLVGNDGNNILIGGAGDDAMYGLGGDDAYVVDSTADKIVEAAGKGTDNISTSISYQLGAGVSVETLRTVNAAATTAINLAGNELANAVIGNAGSNMLYGYAGNDDSLTGGRRQRLLRVQHRAQRHLERRQHPGLQRGAGHHPAGERDLHRARCRAVHGRYVQHRRGCNAGRRPHCLQQHHRSIDLQLKRQRGRRSSAVRNPVEEPVPDTRGLPDHLIRPSTEQASGVDVKSTPHKLGKGKPGGRGGF